jgi:lysozyme family protein
MTLSLAGAQATYENADSDIRAMADQIVKREGGYVNNPYDRGGATDYGISLLFARSETYVDANNKTQLTFDLNGDHRVDLTDIQEITPEIAAAVFVSVFYQEVGLGCLPKCLQATAFDTSVNGGQNKAVRLVQNTINSLRAGIPILQAMIPQRLLVDGRMGGKTNLACHQVFDRVGAAVLVNTFCDKRIADYEAIVIANPNDEEFLNGWLTRANSFRIEE